MMPRLTGGVIPSLLVRDLAETFAFYETLGFRITGRSPDGSWGEVGRDDVVVQFFTEPPHGVADRPGLSGTLYIRAEGIDALAAMLAGKLPFAWGPETMAYGMRELGLKDPNGYVLAFTEPVPPA
jgi:catechol 2,3-dioxygenase-like lactoylglutathione lyase family enzyme